MGVLRYLGDKLTNLVANLGTARDKASASYYGAVTLSDLDLWNAYTGSWLPRKIVDIPALDSCRKWRDWQASAKQITAIEAEEKRLGLQAKILEARIKGRLYGGAGVYIGVKGERDTASPLRPESITRGGIDFLTVIPRGKLQADTLDNDPISPTYGKPLFYKISSQTAEARIHPSRLALFGGNPYPDAEYATGPNYGWTDSVLTAAYEACKNADATIANIASLVFEAKVDVFHIPNLMQWLSNDADTTRLIERFRLANIAKGINGAVLLDAEEKYEQKTINFSALTDILREFLNVVAGAADIPVTRLLGQSPGGLNATGDSDLRNYYDRVQAAQTLEMTPAMSALDECLIRSALGARPKEIHYAWASLWQVSETEQSEIGKRNAETIKTLNETGLFPPDALSKAGTNMLVENAIMPGLEDAMAEFPFDAEEQEESTLAAAGAPGEEDPAVIGDAAPRTLYVSRKVINATAIMAHYRAQGVDAGALDVEDLHVTIAYSKEPIDWMKVGEAYGNSADGAGLTVAAGGARLMEYLGGAWVLLFNSWSLSYRHGDILRAGASWDYPDYQPHITIAYPPANADYSRVTPWQGRIELGPEIFAEIDPTGIPS